MAFTYNECSPLKKSTIVEQSLDLRLQTESARNCLKWGCINFSLLVIVWFDISNKCRFTQSCWYWLEYAFAVFLILSGSACFVKYFVFKYQYQKVCGTVYQKFLLHYEDDKSFVAVSKDEEKSNGRKETKKRIVVAETERQLFDEPIINWHSSFEEPSYNRSPSIKRDSLSPTRFTLPFRSGSPTNISPNLSGSGTPSRQSKFSPDLIDSYIFDERTLNKYINEVSRHETSLTEPVDVTFNSSRNTINSFWNYCNSATQLLKNNIYQLAQQQSQTKQTVNEDGFHMHFIDTNSEIIKSISTDKLSQYVANLRFWMSQTILQRLVIEFNKLNTIFRQRGLLDMEIGGMGLEALRKLAENQQFVNQCAPTLLVVLPYLELTINQEYLVQRIKDLAFGSCIANYRWNSGGSYNGQKWSDHLPTDSAILFHVFCVYLDSQLLPLPQGGRPFYSRYVLRRKEIRSVKDTIAEVNNRARCAILYSESLKPKFNFISDNDIHNCSYDHNNLFYVIIQFLIYMLAHHDSTLEGIHLGKSGINILCVIED